MFLYFREWFLQHIIRMKNGMHFKHNFANIRKWKKKVAIALNSTILQKKKCVVILYFSIQYK